MIRLPIKSIRSLLSEIYKNELNDWLNNGFNKGDFEFKGVNYSKHQRGSIDLSENIFFLGVCIIYDSDYIDHRFYIFDLLAFRIIKVFNYECYFDTLEDFYEHKIDLYEDYDSKEDSISIEYCDKWFLHSYLNYKKWGLKLRQLYESYMFNYINKIILMSKLKLIKINSEEVQDIYNMCYGCNLEELFSIENSYQQVVQELKTMTKNYPLLDKVKIK